MGPMCFDYGYGPFRWVCLSGSQEDLQKTIILNAKSLIERDADFSKFAGRILLTYIYEEVLDWSIVDDGIGKLRIALVHAR